jgi:hypothetical protein
MKVLTQITVDAEGDDEQLWALAETIASEVSLPADAFVVGEPVQLTAIDYEGNPRVGLLATCRRRDEQLPSRTSCSAPATARASRPRTAHGWAWRPTT